VGDVTRTRNVSEYMLVLALCLVINSERSADTDTVLPQRHNNDLICVKSAVKSQSSVHIRPTYKSERLVR